MYSIADLLVCVGYLVAVMVVGIISSRRQRNTASGYFRAGNKLPWYVIGFSIVGAGVSSEQFVAEVGYAYKLGLPVANWEWLMLPALSLLLWIFVPLYVRNDIATMPEYLERRFGGQARTLFAWLTIASYVLVNFAVVFYTGGLAIDRMWGLDRMWSVWALAAITGLYAVYGGLTAVAWTSSLQCILLLGGGIYVFFAGMAKIDWDFASMLGEGQRAHLFTSADHPEVPWTALMTLMLSTNVWYFATNQYINQRCLAARNEWHAKTGVLFSAGLLLLLPLATVFPGMIYRALEMKENLPPLSEPDGAYPAVVAAVIPASMRGLVAAAILSAIMSTVSGLVNSTSTLVTLDIVQRGKRGRSMSDAQLVRVGKWSGGLALLIGALFAPVVMKWENIFRYAQDIWAPMAAPVVVIFLAAALWPGATSRGVIACLWLSILSIPLTLAKSIFADYNLSLLPDNLANSMVFAGAYMLVSAVVLVAFSRAESSASRLPLIYGAAVCALVLTVAAWSPVAISLTLLIVMTVTVVGLMLARRAAAPNLWDRSMLVSGPASAPWYTRVGFWWAVLAVILISVYVIFL